MTTSLIANIKSDNNIMVQSLDPTILSHTNSGATNKLNSNSTHDLNIRSSQTNLMSNQINGKPFALNLK